MGKSFGLVDEKLAEANFFLEKINESGLNFFSARCFFSAFLSSARSVTFALQFTMNDVSEFEEWYAKKQQILKQNVNAKFFHEARNESQHTGVNHIVAGSFRSLANGEKEVKYYFESGIFDVARIVPKTDVFSSCLDYMKLLVEIVWECYQEFGHIIDPARYYTIENMRELGLSLEDVEESLGFPRGWTKGIPDNERLRLLRNQVPMPEIDWLFEKYLGVNRFGKT